jgi:hypothetical protein
VGTALNDVRLYRVRSQVWDRASGGYKTADVQLEIDLTELAASLGAKAWRNKSQRSRLAVGVKAKIVAEA